RNEAFPRWSPDGSRLVFTSWADNLDSKTAEVGIMNADGSGRTLLTSNGFEDSYPNWSASGSKITFQSDRDGNLEIYAMDPDRTGVVRLTNSAGDDVGGAWR